MSATVIIVESPPETWPGIDPEGASAIPAAPQSGEDNIQRFARAAWQRVEQWVSHRWSERSVVFTVEGPGDWVSPLGPFVPDLTERWADNDWVEVALAPNAFGGLVLDCFGPFRITGTLGADAAPPEVVREAVWRLAKYFEAVDAVPAGERSLVRQQVNLGPMSFEREHATSWTARALQQSGAADLLRPYRRLGGL